MAPHPALRPDRLKAALSGVDSTQVRRTRPTATRKGPPACRDDLGAVVLGWLVRLVAGLGAAGLLVFDGLSIATASVTLQDQAASAAREGMTILEHTPTAQAVYDAALASATGDDPLNMLAPADVRTGPDGTVTLTLHRTAPTLVLRHIGWCRDWADRSATASAAPMW